MRCYHEVHWYGATLYRSATLLGLLVTLSIPYSAAYALRVRET
jgi:hypothetical protein